MDIFTDASFNQDTKMAGIGMVFVTQPESGIFHKKCAYFSTDNNETAELFAISSAIAHITPFHPKTVRLFSDSTGALRKLQRIFKYPNQRQIETIRDLSQKKIIYNISSSFSMIWNADFSFHYIHGHQKKTTDLTDGYYNMIADQEASSGRLLGEMILQSEDITSAERKSLGRKEIDQQGPCWIGSPTRISFHYKELNHPSKPKLISRYSGRKKKTTIIRPAQKDFSRIRR